MMRGLRNLLEGGLCAAVVVVLDQWSKIWALDALRAQRVLDILPCLDFTLAFNEGISFGLLKAESAWSYAALIGIALFIMVVFTIWLFKSTTWLPRVALGLILGGALGNVWDRLRYGFVVDFIDAHWHNHHWYTFNIADAAITLGAALLLLEALILEPRRARH